MWLCRHLFGRTETAETALLDTSPNAHFGESLVLMTGLYVQYSYWTNLVLKSAELRQVACMFGSVNYASTNMWRRLPDEKPVHPILYCRNPRDCTMSKSRPHVFWLCQVMSYLRNEGIAGSASTWATEVEGIPSQGGRGVVLFRRMPPYLTSRVSTSTPPSPSHQHHPHPHPHPYNTTTLTSTSPSPSHLHHHHPTLTSTPTSVPHHPHPHPYIHITLILTSI